MGQLHVFKDKVELLETIKELESDIQQWISFNKDKEHQIYVLENELKEYRKLQSEVHTDIEKVWMYDGSFPLNKISMEKRAKLIEKVFYKVAQEWIGIDNEVPISK